MVTPDELENKWDDNGKLHLRMTCHINGILISDGNTNDLYHPFTKMIERASMNTNLMPGDYLGSGTVGTGCILELRPENTGGWIKKGDIIKLEVEDLGVLKIPSYNSQCLFIKKEEKSHPKDIFSFLMKMENYIGKNLLAGVDSATYTLMCIISTHPLQ